MSRTRLEGLKLTGRVGKSKKGSDLSAKVSADRELKEEFGTVRFCVPVDPKLRLIGRRPTVGKILVGSS